MVGDDAVLLVQGGALGAAVLEEFLALGGCDELHGSIPVWADPIGPFTETVEPRRFRPESNAAQQCQIRDDLKGNARHSRCALARAVQPSDTAVHGRIRDNRLIRPEVY